MIKRFLSWTSTWRELRLSGASAQDLATQVAQRSADDVAPSAPLYLWILGEHFNLTPTGKSVARQIQDGIASGIGDAALLWEFTEAERAMEPERAYRSLQERQKKAADSRIVIGTRPGGSGRAAKTSRPWPGSISGTCCGREPPYQPAAVEFDKKLVREILDSGDLNRYSEYMRAVDGCGSGEPFPKLLVDPACPSASDASDGQL